MNLKTNLYLKISEQIKLTLKLAHAKKNEEKVCLLNDVKRLQKNLEQVSFEISNIYNQKMQKNENIL